ncbi:hypothetical protein BDZ45DRAFT_74597 [Acephala macrosclerotiorum]|nr:hypothetical protein BDZ45DRAFT_74597 [Acephala macrosclerotiorum]
MGPLRPDDHPTPITISAFGRLMDEEEGEGAASCLMADDGTTDRLGNNPQTAWMGGDFTYPSSMLQSATHNQNMPATTQASRLTRTNSSIWNDTIRYGSSANNNGEPFSNQCPPTTTFPFHVSQHGDNFDFSNFETDFPLFDHATDFGYYPDLNLSQLHTSGAPLQTSQPTYNDNSPESEAYAPELYLH